MLLIIAILFTTRIASGRTQHTVLPFNLLYTGMYTNCRTDLYR
jgi:hypothetical protein